MLSTRKGLATWDLELLLWLRQSELKEGLFSLNNSQNGWHLDHPLRKVSYLEEAVEKKEKEKGRGPGSGEWVSLGKSSVKITGGSGLTWNLFIPENCKQNTQRCTNYWTPTWWEPPLTLGGCSQLLLTKLFHIAPYTSHQSFKKFCPCLTLLMSLAKGEEKGQARLIPNADIC